MKTKIRIQRSDAGNYRHLYFQILVKRWKDSETLEPIGYIHWQGNIGEDRWYGMSFQLDTDKVAYLEEMAKIGKFLNKNSINRDNPMEVFNVLGGVEYVHYNGYFIPASYNGMFMFDVIQKGKVYTRVFAPNKLLAQKMADKMKLDSPIVEVVCQVELGRLVNNIEI